jgi:hypothetical protein
MITPLNKQEAHWQVCPRYLPSLRGWIALILALLASIFLPNSFPARGPSGFLEPVSTQAWVTEGITVAVCLGASAFAAVRGGLADRVAAVIAVLVTVVLAVMFATTSTPNKSLQPTRVGALAVPHSRPTSLVRRC